MGAYCYYFKNSSTQDMWVTALKKALADGDLKIQAFLLDVTAPLQKRNLFANIHKLTPEVSTCEF